MSDINTINKLIDELLSVNHDNVASIYCSSWERVSDGSEKRVRDNLIKAIQDYAREQGHAGVLMGADVARKKEEKE